MLVRRAQLTGSPTDWSYAASYLDRLRAADPRDPAVLLDAGVAADVLGHTAVARFDLSAAAALDPRSSAPRQDLALLNQQLNEQLNQQEDTASGTR